MTPSRRLPYESLIFGWVIFAVYLLGVHRGLPGGDSGELITVASTLGIAHPPGYPLFTLLGHLIASLPLGSVAWRLNLFSAMCASVAASLLFSTLVRVTQSRIAAFFSAVLFAFSFEVWRYAGIAEVFALNNLLCALLFYLYARFIEDENSNWLVGIFFVSGLCASHHHLSSLVVVPLLTVIVVRHWAMFPRSFWMMCIGALCVGLLPYLYFPLHASQVTSIRWGDLTTIQGFLTHFFRSEYGSFQLVAGLPSATVSTFFSNLIFFSGTLLWDALGIGCLAFIVVFASKKKRHAIVLPVVCGFILTVVVFHALANMDARDPFYRSILSRFWQQAHLCFFIVAGIGAARMIQKNTQKTISYASVILLVGIVLKVMPQAGLSQLYRHDLFRQYTNQIFETVPPQAILLTCGDVVGNSARYLQEVEGQRRDIAPVEIAQLKHDWYERWLAKKYPDVKTRGKGMSLIEFLDANIGTRAIYAAGQLCNFDGNAELPRKYGELYEGCANKIVARINHPETMEEYEQGSKKLFSCLSGIDPKMFSADSWERGLFVALQDVRGEFLERMNQFIKKNPSPPLERQFREVASSWTDRQKLK